MFGLGAKSTAQDIKHSLSWWGISKIGVFNSALMSNLIWDKLPEKRRKSLTRKINSLARKFARINYAKPAHTKIAMKIKFMICRFIQKQVQKNGVAGLDYEYWQTNGWLAQKRPWKY